MAGMKRSLHPHTPWMNCTVALGRLMSGIMDIVLMPSESECDFSVNLSIGGMLVSAFCRNGLPAKNKPFMMCCGPRFAYVVPGTETWLVVWDFPYCCQGTNIVN